MKLAFFDHPSKEQMPDGCVCDPETWCALNRIPDAFAHFEPRRDCAEMCVHCDHHPDCHVPPNTQVQP